MVLLVFACSKPVFPRRTKVSPNDIKRAIQKAQDACFISNRTPACRVMWDHVDELSRALARQEEPKEPEWWDELETREYDV